MVDDERLHQALIGIQRDGDEHEPTIPVLMPEPLQGRHLLPAGWTPGRPEVDENDLAALIGESEFRALQQRHGEILGRLGPPRADEVEVSHRSVQGEPAARAGIDLARRGRARRRRVKSVEGACSQSQKHGGDREGEGSRHGLEQPLYYAGCMLTILADDLTGACDTGTLFAGGGAVPVTVWPQPAAGAAVRVLDTESRALSATVAARRVEAAARRAASPRYFKKIDSTFRGHVGAEVNALLLASGAVSAVLTPAFPAQGRTVLDRLLFVDGIPIAETVIARDPEFPDPETSSVVDL